MTRPRAKPIKVFVTDEEREQIRRRALDACLPMSSYLRAAGLNHKVHSRMDINTISELARIHAELGRLATEKDMQRLRDLQTLIHQLMGRAVR